MGPRPSRGGSRSGSGGRCTCRCRSRSSRRPTRRECTRRRTRSRLRFFRTLALSRVCSVRDFGSLSKQRVSSTYRYLGLDPIYVSQSRSQISTVTLCFDLQHDPSSSTPHFVIQRHSFQTPQQDCSILPVGRRDSRTRGLEFVTSNHGAFKYLSSIFPYLSSITVHAVGVRRITVHLTLK